MAPSCKLFSTALERERERKKVSPNFYTFYMWLVSSVTALWDLTVKETDALRHFGDTVEITLAEGNLVCVVRTHRSSPSTSSAPAGSLARQEIPYISMHEIVPLRWVT